MNPTRSLADRLCRVAAVAVVGLVLTACATTARPPTNFLEADAQSLPQAQAQGPQTVASNSPPKEPVKRRKAAKAARGPGQAARLATSKPYQVRGVWYTPSQEPGYNKVGLGSWYGEQFHNRQTANGEMFDMNVPSAAHKTLPLPSLVEVTNLGNGRKIVVRVNDRGPFVGDRIIDLSKAAASKLDYQRAGVTRVRVRYLGPAPQLATEARTYKASLPDPSPRAPTAKPIRIAAVARPSQAEAPPDAPGAPELRPIRVSTAGSPSNYATIQSDYRVQAGAFSTRTRAQNAMARLPIGGHAEVVEKQGVYCLMLTVAGEENGAWAMRDRLADVGFDEAKVIVVR